MHTSPRQTLQSLQQATSALCAKTALGITPSIGEGMAAAAALADFFTSITDELANLRAKVERLESRMNMPAPW